MSGSFDLEGLGDLAMSGVYGGEFEACEGEDARLGSSGRRRNGESDGEAKAFEGAISRLGSSRQRSIEEAESEADSFANDDGRLGLSGDIRIGESDGEAEGFAEARSRLGMGGRSSALRSGLREREREKRSDVAVGRPGRLYFRLRTILSGFVGRPGLFFLRTYTFTFR